jgi:hypothetical protein
MEFIPLDGPSFPSALSDSGFLYILMIHPASGAARLECRDLQGRLVWKQSTTSSPRSPSQTLRLSSDGKIWVLSNDHLSAYDIEGRLTTKLPLPITSDERCGAFVLENDGLIASLFSVSHEEAKPGRVVRLGMNGSLLWSTEIPIEPVSHEGIVEMRAQTGFRQERKPDWRPQQWEPTDSEPLLVSDSYVLASYFEMGSGLGRSYCLDRTEGRLLWTTAPAPSGDKAIVGAGQFLIGEQGYGTFSTTLYASDGSVLQRWKSHGYCIVDAMGAIRLVEMENVLPSRMRVAKLSRDGTVTHGRRLNGYRTSYPVLTEDGQMIFWREEENRLFSVDAELNISVLSSTPIPTKAYFFGRTLLADTGILFFTSNSWQDKSYLCILKTHLRPATNAIWACANGNMANNPVVEFL